MKEPIVNIAVRAARAAGNIIIRAMDKLDTLQISEKNHNDFVTEVDKASEKEIIKIIKKAYPTHAILAEEGGETSGEEYTWIIDPLDGTRNFIHGFPQFAVSIGVAYKGKIEHGVIYDPVKQELFTASRGKGAQFNERRIRVAKRSSLEGCLLATGFPYRRPANFLDPYIDALKSLLPICGDVRRAGSAALDLAYVACGRLDGYFELGLKPWDLAAGTLLIKEAGGLVTDFHGTEDYLKSGNVVAGNPKILKLLLQQLSPYLIKADEFYQS